MNPSMKQKRNHRHKKETEKKEETGSCHGRGEWSESLGLADVSFYM